MRPRSYGLRTVSCPDLRPIDQSHGDAKTIKTGVLLTAAWIGLVIAIGLIGCVIIGHSSSSPSGAVERAGMLGSGLGVVAAIGCGVLWLPVIAEVGRRNREKRLGGRKR